MALLWSGDLQRGQDPIGAGGSFLVYPCTALGRPYALKVPNVTSRRALLLREFLMTLALKQQKGGQHIVNYIAYFDSEPAILMELYEGTLKAALRTPQYRLQTDAAWQLQQHDDFHSLLRQVTAGLECLGSIEHRDLHTGNILYKGQPRLWVIADLEDAEHSPLTLLHKQLAGFLDNLLNETEVVALLLNSSSSTFAHNFFKGCRVDQQKPPFHLLAAYCNNPASILQLCASLQPPKDPMQEDHMMLDCF